MTLEVDVWFSQEIWGQAVIDEVDAWALDYKWRCTPYGHVYRNTRLTNPDGSTTCRRVYLHREILRCDFGDGFVVDHIDGDPFNNRRQNLERCYQWENTRRAKAKVKQ